MTFYQSFLLGLIQGLTEFLPISSSGHLVIAQHLFQLSKAPIFFDVLVHLGTSLAVIIVVFESLTKITIKKIKLIILASLPAAVFGLLLNSKMEQLFSSLRIVGFALLVTSAFLFSTKLIRKAPKIKLNYKNSFLIGFSQALAIIPGISRSGSTIITGMHLGLSPAKAFNFSFLLSLPAIFGAQILQLNKISNFPSSQFPILLTGFTTAFISGLIALKMLKRFVIKGKLHYFGFYCLILGLVVLIF